MNELINEIYKDIKRCEDVCIENNYLEIVIAIEELYDKYKDTILDIKKLQQNVVWNYSKKDIEIIKNYLEKYRDDIKKIEKEKNIIQKIDDLKSHVKNDELIEVINEIECICNKEINLDKKWAEIKNTLDIIKKYDRYIATKILEIIMLIIEN